MNKLKNRLWALCLAAPLGLLALPAAAQNQVFAFDVPDSLGAGTLEIARVKTVFTASGGFGVSPQIDFGGGVVVNVPSAVCDGTNGATCQDIGVFGAASHIATVARLATNKVMVAIDLKDLPSNLCGGRSGNVAFSITLVNVAATSAEMASYIAPNCNQAVQRSPVKTTLTTPAGFGAVGRLPLTVTLVLDRSGSMTLAMPGGAPGESRWDRLKSAVQQFVNVWQVAGASSSGPAPVPVEGNADDRMGLTLFGSAAASIQLDPAAAVAWEKVLKKRGAVSNSWDVVVSSLPASPGGATTIGGGLAEGLARLKDVPEILRNDGVLVMFTDGEQNTAPCVSREGATIGSLCNITGGVGAALTLNGVKLTDSDPVVPMLTIGLGASSGPFAELLDQIAQQTAGRARITTGGAALDLAFVDQLVQALKGNTMALLKREQNTIAAAADGSAPMTVLVDGGVQRLVVAAGWQVGRTAQIELRRPDGTVVTAPIARSGSGSQVVGIDIPAGGPPGNWQVRLLRPLGAQGAVPYHLSAYSVENRLSYRLSESPRVGTAEPVKVEAVLSWDGRPLTGLPAGALVVTVERPGENLGNLLSQERRFDPASAGGDSQDAVSAKIAALLADPGNRDKVEPKPLPTTLRMKEIGDGRYQAEFDATVVGGQYRFRVDMNWNDPRTGSISRVETIERQVPVRPTPAATSVSVSAGASAGTAQLTVTPVDGFGNRVGPGYGGYLVVTAAPGVMAGPVTDPGLTGTYRVTLSNIPPGADPRVKIDYRGAALRDAPLSQLQNPGTGGGAGGGGKYALWGGLGMAFPHGSFANTHRRGGAAALGVEYKINNDLAAEATLAHHKLNGKGANVDADVTQLGLNAKFYFLQAPVRMFGVLGAGVYNFDPGSTRFGLNAGLGVQWQLAPQWALEGRYTLHGVANNSPRSSFSSLLVGVRYAF